MSEARPSAILRFIVFILVTRSDPAIASVDDLKAAMSRKDKTLYGASGATTMAAGEMFKTMSGVHRPTRGSITFEGQPLSFASPRDAMEFLQSQSAEARSRALPEIMRRWMSQEPGQAQAAWAARCARRAPGQRSAGRRSPR